MTPSSTSSRPAPIGASEIYVRLPGCTSVKPAVVAFVSGDRDLAILETEQLDARPRA